MIYLVRHGQSVGNLDLKNYRETADHAFRLTDLGKEQAEKSGLEIARNFDRVPHFSYSFMMWASPYERTRETSRIIIDVLENKGISCLRSTESPLIIEKQYGVYNQIAGEPEKFQECYPDYNTEYLRCVDFNGRFFARPPGGESDFDVYTRVELFWSKLLKVDPDLKRHHVIVCHGTTMRLLAMAIMEKPYEWFQNFPMPDNGGIIIPNNGLLADGKITPFSKLIKEH